MDNFYKTAIRTSKSSKILINNGDYFNSCYIGGYTLECYSKILLKLAYGMTDDELKKYIGHDLKKAVKEIKYLKLDPSINGLIDSIYLLDINIDCPFMTKSQTKWNPNKRYNDNETNWNQNTATEYQNEIVKIRQKIATMKINGVI